MIQAVQRRVKNEKGLTLVELLAVIVILAIVAAIAIPAIGNIIENSRYKAVKADAINVLNAANIYFTENPTEADGSAIESVDVDTLKDDGFLESAGKIAGDAEVTYVTEANTLKTDEIVFSGSKAVEFDVATLDDINRDTENAKNITAGTAHKIGGGTPPTNP